MTIYSLERIKSRVESLGSIINAPEYLLPTYGHSKDFGHPHIEIDPSGLLHYVIMERGKELERKSTDDVDELLYWVFSGITFSIACSFELRHRIPFRDVRRHIFEKQEQLLGELNPTWKQKESDDHQRILEHHPFNDLGFNND